jgi:hypothetical protein
MCQLAEASLEAASSDHNIDPSFQSLIPATVLSKKVYDFASQHLSPAIFNHSLRIYLYSSHLATLPQLPPTPPTLRPSPCQRLQDLLFTASMFHDIGTSSSFNGPSRFEICGADAAVSFLHSHAPEIPATEVHDVWTAIACHTSPGIGEEISVLSRLIRLAVMTDFDYPGLRVELGVVAMVEGSEGRLPRLDIEKVLGDAVVKQIMEKKEGVERNRKAPGDSWPGRLLKGELEKEEGYTGVNAAFARWH